MLKIMTIVGTRPEIIRLSRIINKIDVNFNHKLVHTGQNFDHNLNEIFFSQLKIRKPDFYLDAAGSSAADTIGNIIKKTDKLFKEQKPDALLILGDTNSALASISAKRNKIPIFHMEAGNRCFDFTVPEEINRRIIDHISDINLTYTQIAREYLLREGLPPDQVIVIGSPLNEVLRYYSYQIQSATIINDLSLKFNSYFLVSFHREENVDDILKLENLISILNQLVEKYNMPIIFSTHPRTKLRLKQISLKPHSLIKFLSPFGYFDYISLQQNAKCVLSDSGTISEESSILNFPALNLRYVNERPEGFEEGAVPMVGLNNNLLFQAINLLDNQKRGSEREINIVRDYSSTNVSEKVVRILLSYTDYINRKTWKKFN